MRVQRVSAGFYRATDEAGRTVNIERRDDLGAWIASAEWDRDLYGDPDPTYREAKITAAELFELRS